MFKFVAPGLAGLLMSLAVPAVAGPYAVQTTAVQLAFPNSGPRVAQDYLVGDAILDVPLLWLSAATLRAPVAIAADGEAEFLPAGTVLPLHVLAEAGGSPVRAYCTPRRAAERAADRGMLRGLLGSGTLWRGLIRGATDRQLCLIDSDGDGGADQSVVVGDGSREARTPRTIPPVPIETADLVRVSDQDRLRIVVTRLGRRNDWADFELEIVQQGHKRVFDTFSGTWGSSSRVTRIPMGPESPGVASIAGADFSILSVDRANRSLRLQWAEGAEASRPVVIPDGLRVVVQ
jgi:hypothetical protein